MDNLNEIIDKYIGMLPIDVSCTTWTEMRDKFKKEIHSIVSRSNEDVEYTVKRFNKNSKALDIEGKNLIYAQFGSSHHGCQCNLNGEDKNHSIIKEKLKDICELFLEIEELNKPLV